MANNALQKIDAARRALASAKTVTEVKDIRDKAEAIRTFAEMAKDHSLMLEAGEIRIRAERRLGEMLIEQKEYGLMSKGAATKGVGRRGKKRGTSGDPRITLEELGIGKALADRARKLGRMERSDFIAFLDRWRDGKRLKDLLQEERTRLGAARIKRRGKKIGPREIGPFIDGTLEGDEIPEEYASVFQKLEHLLRINMTATTSEVPERYNSYSKVVANTLWRLLLLMRFAHEPNAMVKFVDIMEQLDARLLRIEHAHLAATKSERKAGTAAA